MNYLQSQFQVPYAQCLQKSLLWPKGSSIRFSWFYRDHSFYTLKKSSQRFIQYIEWIQNTPSSNHPVNSKVNMKAKWNYKSPIHIYCSGCLTPVIPAPVPLRSFVRVHGDSVHTAVLLLLLRLLFMWRWFSVHSAVDRVFLSLFSLQRTELFRVIRFLSFF